MWTVECYRGIWSVVDEDGQVVRRFDTQVEAEDWLDFQQAAAEAAWSE